MGILRMDSEGLHSLSREISSKSSTFENLKNNYKSTSQNMVSRGVWTGKDADDYRKAAEDFDLNLQTAIQILDEISEKFESTATEYDTVHEDVTNSISSIRMED